MKTFRIALFALLTCCIVLPARAQDDDILPTDSLATDTLASPRHVVIGAKNSPPFMYRENGQWTGISFQLWQLIAQELNITYEFRDRTLPEILDDLENGHIDICINPLTVTSERIQQFDFTQPFYGSHSAVASVAQESKSAWDYARQFFSLSFLKVILLLLLVLLIFGFLVWFFERRSNPDEFSNNLQGLWSGLWWSAVTMTTVGYGDKSPRTLGGRMVGLIWMFTAVIIISSFTASITSALTVDRLDSDIEKLEDLRKHKTGSLVASASSSFLKHNYIRHQLFDEIEAGLWALEDGKIEAFVYDEPILRYYIEEMQLEETRILPLKFNPQYYSFALPKGSELIAEINPVLLSFIEGVNWKMTLSEYGLGEQ
ncbi:MAG: transporter substrate-binding domain-containing protein [Bacteroidota bacterium]